jgi:hypothetical protein
VNRRSFITLLGSAAASWPLVARAQQPAMLVFRFVSNRSPNNSPPVEAPFRLRFPRDVHLYDTLVR